MGAVYPGVPKQLAQFLHERYTITDFVETGTYLGNTSLWASEVFDRVHTIELSEALYSRAKSKYKDVGNISFHQGNSLDVLRTILPNISKPALFWLDAHYSCGETAGEGIACPLLGEIKEILNADEDHVLLIDDARFLLLYPPTGGGHAMPSIEDVFKLLNTYRYRYSIVWRDVLISVPKFAKETVYDYLCAQGDLVLSSYFPDFSHSGVRAIAKSWKVSLLGLLHLPGAIVRTIKNRI